MFGAVESDGTLWVWGSNYNTYAGIGTGPGSSSTSPIRVTSLSGYRITAVSLSGTHGMALQDDGSVWTWGSNGSGQLGDRTSTDAYWPLKISSFTEVQSISAGGYCSAALKTDGTLWMWGEGSGYQFGQGYMMNYNCGTPISVPITGVAAVANNGYTPMALKTDGTVWTWGGSDYSPVQISGLSGITMIDNGSAKLAVGTDGAVWSWGSNTHGQLGDGTTVDKAAPALIPGMSGAAMVAAGNNFSVIVKSDDTVWACGHNDAGQLGNGRAPRRSLPCPVPGLADVVSVAMGYRNAAALKSNGTVWTWGDNGGGCLGDGTNVNRNVPIQVPGLSGAVSVVAAGWAAVLALKSDGTVWGWGTNTSGQVGDGSRTQRKSPVQVTISNVRALSAADEFVVALKNDGTVWAWGDNQYGQLGDGTATTRTSPVQVQGLSNVVAVAAGGKTTMALKSDGTLWGCGANDRNQLGLAACDYVAHKTVSQITVIDNVAAVALPSGNVAVTKRDGSVWVWGNNGYYDLGDPTGTSHYQPWQAPLFSGSTSIVGTNRHMMAIRSDGTLLACGREDEGVLGRGSSAPSQSPWPVRGITGVTAGAVGWLMR